MKIWIHIQQQDEEIIIVDNLFVKSLQMVTSAMKLKDTCSMKVKLWQT